MASREGTPASVELEHQQGAAPEAAILHCGGDWVTANLERLAQQLAALKLKSPLSLEVSLETVGRLDSAAAWQLCRHVARWQSEGVTVQFTGISDDKQALLDNVGALGDLEPPREARSTLLIALIERCGRASIWFLLQARDLINFMGMTVIAMARALLRPRRLRFAAIFTHMERTGFDALPIVGLLSFLIGVVLAYQGADQLRRFGAEIFTVNLVGIGVLREMGILITAIIVAGRSGSAFTAQIGTMQVNEEIDALETIGLDPVDVLVLPRVIALILVLPLLTFYADIMGVLGGAVMSLIALDITPSQFITQFHGAVPIDNFFVGIGKAPIFAFVIALVGCFQGMRVSRSAESVGQQTTRAVVQSIFIVIVLDAIFSIFFSIVGI